MNKTAEQLVVARLHVTLRKIAYHEETHAIIEKDLAREQDTLHILRAEAADLEAALNPLVPA